MIHSTAMLVTDSTVLFVKGTEKYLMVQNSCMSPSSDEEIEEDWRLASNVTHSTPFKTMMQLFGRSYVFVDNYHNTLDKEEAFLNIWTVHEEFPIV